MRLSEVISRLIEIREQKGDLIVEGMPYAAGGYPDYDVVTSIEVNPEASRVWPRRDGPVVRIIAEL